MGVQGRQQRAARMTPRGYKVWGVKVWVEVVAGAAVALTGVRR